MRSEIGCRRIAPPARKRCAFPDRSRRRASWCRRWHCRVDRAEKALGIADHGGSEHAGPIAIARHAVLRLGAHFRREVDQVVRNFDEVARVSGRLGGERLRGRGLLAGHIGLRHRTFLDRPDRLAGDAIEHIKERFLAGQGDGFDGLAIDIDVGQDGRGGKIVVPDGVMHDLEVPLALAGLQIDADQAFAEQVVAGTLAAVVVRGRDFDRQIDQAEFFVDGHLGPDAGVAVGGPGAVLPGVVAELARARDGVEGPEQLAGAGVEGANQALGVVVGHDRHAFLEGRADDHDILHHERRGVEAGFAGFQIDLLRRCR